MINISLKNQFLSFKDREILEINQRNLLVFPLNISEFTKNFNKIINFPILKRKKSNLYFINEELMFLIKNYFFNQFNESFFLLSEVNKKLTKLCENNKNFIKPFYFILLDSKDLNKNKQIIKTYINTISENDLNYISSQLLKKIQNNEVLELELEKCYFYFFNQQKITYHIIDNIIKYYLKKEYAINLRKKFNYKKNYIIPKINDLIYYKNISKQKIFKLFLLNTDIEQIKEFQLLKLNLKKIYQKFYKNLYYYDFISNFIEIFISKNKLNEQIKFINYWKQLKLNLKSLEFFILIIRLYNYSNLNFNIFLKLQNSVL